MENNKIIDIIERMMNLNDADLQTSYRESFQNYLKNPTGGIKYWDKLVEPYKKYNDASMTDDKGKKKMLFEGALEELKEVCEWEKNNLEAFGQEHAKELTGIIEEELKNL